MPRRNDNFYNLPPPWNPGYAIPEATYDEGLERRAFVTAMVPRGTYSAPKVGHGGYALPKYVKDEGYGQGAFITKWLPRGYYGPNLPHYLDQTFTRITGERPASGGGVVFNMQTLGDDAPVRYPAPGIFGTYGKRAAAAMISSVQSLPPERRADAMRAAMNKIDPSLYGRAQKYTQVAARQGATPKAALAHGLAAAMSQGFLAELSKLGKTRAMPQPNSLLGLGLYHQDLGASPLDRVSPGALAAIAGGATATKVLHVGPFSMPMEEGKKIRVYAQTLPAVVGSNGKTTLPAVKGMTTEQASVLQDAIAKATKTYNASSNLGTGFSGPAFLATYAKMGLPWSSEPTVYGQKGVDVTVTQGKKPLMRFNHPSDGKNSVVMMNYVGERGGAIDLWWEKRMTIAEALWIALKAVGAFIEDIGEAIGSALKTIACGAVTAPGAAAAAGAASGGAAAVGTGLAAGMCGGAAYPPPPPQTPILPVLLIGGGALLLLAAMKKSKKGTP